MALRYNHRPRCAVFCLWSLPLFSFFPIALFFHKSLWCTGELMFFSISTEQGSFITTTSWGLAPGILCLQKVSLGERVTDGGHCSSLSPGAFFFFAVSLGKSCCIHILFPMSFYFYWVPLFSVSLTFAWMLLAFHLGIFSVLFSRLGKDRRAETKSPPCPGRFLTHLHMLCPSPYLAINF